MAKMKVYRVPLDRDGYTKRNAVMQKGVYYGVGQKLFCVSSDESGGSLKYGDRRCTRAPTAQDARKVFERRAAGSFEGMSRRRRRSRR